MAKELKATIQETARPAPPDECDLLLTLKPAELEALIARMCACSTRRVRLAQPRHARRRCAGRASAEWCCLGARAAGGYVGTRFG